MASDMESNNSSVERGAGKNKRKWTEDEDEKLVEALMKTLKKDFGVVYDICYGANSSGLDGTQKTMFLRHRGISIKGFALNSNAQLYRFRLLMLSTSFEEDLQRSTHSDESTSKKMKKGNVKSLLEAVYAASDRISNQFEASTKLLIATEEDMMQKKKQLNDELSEIPNLTVLQKLQVPKKIAKDEDLMILFFEAPAEEKIVLVNAILNNQI
ncbi:hypothetical protein ACET3Z_000848 [Daucus carota]